MTCIMAIRCQDGIVVTSDTQMTDQFGMKHHAAKISEVGEHSILVSSGAERYMPALARNVRKAVESRNEAEDLEEVLVRANRLYSEEVGPPARLTGKHVPEMQAIFAAYDERVEREESKFRLFEWQPPAPPVPRSYYATGGSGLLSADFVLQKADFFLVDTGTDWSKLSSTTVLRLSLILLRMVQTYHSDVSGYSFSLIEGNKKPRDVLASEFFPQYSPTDPKEIRDQFAMLMASLIQDMGKANLFRFAQSWGIIEKLEQAGIKITLET